MADVQLDVQLTFKVAEAEFRILGLALAGRLKRQEDKAAADRLNKKLMEQRERAIGAYQQKAAEIAGKTKKKTGGGG